MLFFPALPAVLHYHCCHELAGWAPRGVWQGMIKVASNVDLDAVLKCTCVNCVGGLPEDMPEYAPFSDLKCAHPQPLHLIGTTLKCSWRYKLPEYLLKIV
eukprot:1160595-Pelagomonas_calceolata.AAC.4